MLTRLPLRDQVYREVLESIHRGDAAPGSRVRDTDLATTLGVSRTPVREALLRLTREGVLDSDLGRGFRVPPFDEVEIGQVGQILGSIESLALELTPDFPAEQLNRLAKIDAQLEQTRGDAMRCVDLEDEWHRVLLERCPNRHLLDLIAQLRQVSRRYLAAYLRNAARIALSTLPHQKIADALRRHDRETAHRLLIQHWERGIGELQSWAAGPHSSTERKVAER